MEYLNSRFTKKWRRFLLIVCFVLFFGICPIIVMLASGYRYDWRNGFLRETGSISIDTLPLNAKIFLNDIPLKTSMPIRLNNITPRKYLLTITAPGFYDWQKEIEVKNKQTVYIKEISLLRNNAPKKISERRANNLAISTDGRFLAYYADGSLWIYDTQNQTEEKIYDNQNNLSLQWSPKQHFLLSAETNGKNLKITDWDKKQQWDINSPDKNKINKYVWRDLPDPEIVFSTNEYLYIARPQTEKIISITKNQYWDWGVDNNIFWAIINDSAQKTTAIYKDTLGFPEKISVAPDDLSEIMDPKWKILQIKANVLLLKKDGESTMILINKGKKFKLNGEEVLISNYHSWWLIWTPWELWSFSDGQEPKILNRSGEQLRQIWSLDEYNTLALVWNDKITALFPYYGVGFTLLNQTIAASVVDQAKKIIYYSVANEIDEKGIWALSY